MTQHRERALGPGDSALLSAFFSEIGSNCYCRYLQFEGDKNEWQARLAFEPEQNRLELEQGVQADRPDARFVGSFDQDGQLQGFIRLAPAEGLEKLWQGRYYGGLPIHRESQPGVWLLACALIRPERRKTGVYRALVAEAIVAARREGATRLRALPRKTVEPVAAEELWGGVHQVLRDAGFEHAAGDEAYPVLELVLGSS